MLINGGDPFGFSSPVACKMSQHAQAEEQSTMGNDHILILFFSPDTVALPLLPESVHSGHFFLY